MRVKFYREHKYVSFALNDLERLIAKVDFCNKKEVTKAKSRWEEVSSMLEHHAQYEEEKLHPLLEKKGSTAHLHAHEEHEELDNIFAEINTLFKEALVEKNEEEQIELGYKLYLTYRKFVGFNLLHLHEEETKILPELQRLYTDDELRLVEDSTYKILSVEEMWDMLKILFPHMNPSDKKAFLEDIKLSQPEKFLKLQERFT